MRKIETTWNYILTAALDKKRFRFTQQEIARSLGYSLSTINHAIALPAQIGAIRKTSKFFVLEDFKKLLYYWASLRRFERDIFYKTYFDASVTQIEGLVPQGVVYACYSSVRKLFVEVPADYDKAYFYCDEKSLPVVKERFLSNSKSFPNVFVIKKPENLLESGFCTSVPNTFVDIWNLRDWYSKDFTNFLEEKINGILS